MNKLSFTSIAVLSIVIFTNCNKNEADKQSPQNTIYFQEYNIDTTNYDSDTIYYDIDGYMVLDLQVIKSIEIGTSIVRYSGTLNEINEPMKFCYMKTEPITKMVELGDEITNSNVYNWYSKVNYSGSTPYFSENHYWAAGTFTDYFGFQIEKDDGSHFGWFHLKHFEIKEIAINQSPNKQIIVGQKE